MNLLLVNTQPIPSSGVGAASVNRILSYTKGLINEGIDVRILSTAFGPKGWDEFENVPVKHLGIPSSFLPFRLFCMLFTALNLFRNLSNEKKDLVVLVSDSFILIILMGIYRIVSKTKIVLEVNEYPFILMSRCRIKKKMAPIFINTIYKSFDGIIVISKPLLDFYSSKARKTCRLLEVPITVDGRRFRNLKYQGDNTYGDYVAYCGNMGGNKDGLANLLYAFSIVEKRGYPLNLLLIGGATNQSDFDNLKKLNEELGNRNVIFYGKANRAEMPQLLKNAKILALARPSSIQSTGGLPTKLGEYLSTGNPVIITSVGDIPRYLENKKNAYVVSPDDNQAFAEAICYVWDNYSEAKIVGAKGKKLAETVFDGNYQAVRMAFFFNELLAQ